MSSDLVLVTGASGYVAGHCMLRLLHDGYRVRGTLRSLQRAGAGRQWLTKARGGIAPGDALPYTRSKTIAEKAAWAELPKLPRPLEWVAINPGLVLGPVLEKDSSASVQIVAKLLKGEIPGLPRFGYAVVDVRDLADLEVRAMRAPQAAGQRYIGAGPFTSLSEIANVLKDRWGDKAKKAPTRHLPD